MADVVISPNMSLPVPIVGVEPGPAWAQDINSCMGILDQHDHSSGQGVKITPTGININADLPINGNNLTLVKTVNFSAQLAPLAGLSPNLGCVYVAGNELYYNDEAGNVVQITNTGSVNAGAGSITGLPSGTASASYSSGPGTFIWQSATNTPANMDNASVTIREQVSMGNGVTLKAPTGLAANYNLIFPSALPGSTKFLTVDTSGNIGDVYDVDNSTIEVSSNLIQVKNGGITLAKMAANSVDTPQLVNGSVTRAKQAAVGQQEATSSLNSVYVSMGTYQQISNQSINITTTGRPVVVNLIAADPSNPAKIFANGGTASLWLGLHRDGVLVYAYDLQTSTNGDALPIPSVLAFDGVVAGTYAYDLKVLFNAGSATSVRIDYFKIVAYEL